MVRSTEGWRWNGNGWERRYVWSTWTTFDDAQTATEEEAMLESGGVVTALITEEQCLMFSLCNTLC